MTDKATLSLDISPDFSAVEGDPLQHLRDWMRGHRIEEVECAIPDLAGIARGKVMPAAKFIKDKAKDLPRVDVKGKEFSHFVKSIGDAFG
ncbi:MAG: hypothetical protein ACPGID_13510, partial [Rubricella sp.]